MQNNKNCLGTRLQFDRRKVPRGHVAKWIIMIQPFTIRLSNWSTLWRTDKQTEETAIRPLTLQYVVYVEFIRHHMAPFAFGLGIVAENIWRMGFVQAHRVFHINGCDYWERQRTPPELRPIFQIFYLLLFFFFSGISLLHYSMFLMRRVMRLIITSICGYWNVHQITSTCSMSNVSYAIVNVTWAIYVISRPHWIDAKSPWQLRIPLHVKASTN